jgi:sterol desaturase/sphingolipid hydroxylase (fatty acid hydroxylase superfamily)
LDFTIVTDIAKKFKRSHYIPIAIGVFVAPMAIYLTFTSLEGVARFEGAIQFFKQQPIFQEIIQAGHTFVDFFNSRTLYPLAICILALEFFLPANRAQKPISPGFLLDFLWSLGSITILAILAKILYWGFDLLVSKPLLVPHIIRPFSGWNPIVVFIISLIAIDFFAWVSHYMVHRVPLFWYFHAVHHAPREMNMFTNERTHPIDGFIRKVIELPIFVLFSLDLSLIPYFLLATDLHGRLFHSNIKTNWGFLKHLIVTPQYHRVHHSFREEHLDKNFGDIFTIWDRIFGTQIRDYDVYPETGIHDENFPSNDSLNIGEAFITFWRQVLYPFKQVFGKKLQS